MTSTKYINISQSFPFVLHVELARGPVNAFTTEFWTEYGAVFDRVSAGDYGDIRVVVLSSALPKAFSAGIDFQGLSFDTAFDSADPARTAHALRTHLLAFQDAISAPERCPVPVIAAVHGVAYGLAIDIIAACDVRYAAGDATFSIKEVDVGLAADIGTLARLPKITGNQSLARELAYTARTFSSTEAEKLGLVSRVVVTEGLPGNEREAVVGAAFDLAREIASKSPVAVRGTKRLLLHSRDHGVPENLDYTATWNSAMIQTSDLPEAVRAAKSKSREPPTFSPVLPVLSKSKL
ncbi:Delta2-dienoyl-CoA-isomerase [Gyrodon lividus]|nr:Delta2-dienoyl-CoA-isomerase [Gyrodon lividus]